MYEYDTLPDPERYIRLAILRPGLYNGSLRTKFIFCEPEVCASCSDTLFPMLTICEADQPAYEALSYVWGPKENTLSVKVDSKAQSSLVSITRNLDVALRHLRSKVMSRLIWIDALCINHGGQ
jgi:hypothetical protein